MLFCVFVTFPCSLGQSELAKNSFEFSPLRYSKYKQKNFMIKGNQFIILEKVQLYSVFEHNLFKKETFQEPSQIFPY